MLTWLILTAVVTDLIIGDPVYRYHPVRLIGRFALILERPSRYFIKNEKFAGLLTAIITLLVTTFITYIITATLFKISPILGFIAGVFFIYSSIACKDMIEHSRRIYNHLNSGNIILARGATSMIVGRDTKHMRETEIVRATVESVAENSVDGTLAPLFYAFVGTLLFGVEGGACFAMLYRGVNTLDSSFGYKNERHLNFGMISARTDDVFNFIPARLSLVLISLSSFLSSLDAINAFRIGLRDHANHASPNSGYSEAAFAGALGLQFGGETMYADKVVNRPLLGDKAREFDITDITKASKLLFNTTLLTSLLITLILFSLSK